MSLVLGELREDQVPTKFYVNGKTPRCFLLADLQTYNITCVQWWDETHKKQRVGKARSGTNKQYQFPHNEDGVLDLENGKCGERDSELKMKCEKEARFMTGVCLQFDSNGDAVKDEKGRVLGMRLPLLECTEKKVVSHEDRSDVHARAFKAPRDAKDNSRWAQNTRNKKKKHKGDPVTALPGTNDEAADHLEGRKVRETPNGIKTVGDCCDCFKGRQDRRNNFVKAMKRGKVRMSNDIQATAEALAETAEPGAPRTIDHRNNPDCRNPWKSRCGDDWQQKMQESPEPKKTVSVRDLVEHMVGVGEETCKGTRCEHRWGFCHDALSLMCSRANLKWMKDKGYLKCWTLPQNDLDTMFSHCKKPMPVGNHAGGMPWDQSCNKDHDDTVLRHVAATIRLREDDERKFSLRTPKKVASAHKRTHNNPPELRNGKEIMPLGEGGPEPHRLGHDIVEVPKHWRGVFDSEGLNCNSNVGGNRNKDLSEGRKAGKKVKGKWGGDKGVKKGKIASIKSSWCHPDAREALDDFLKKSHQDFEKERTIEKYDNIREEDELEEAAVEEEAATTATTTATDDDIDVSSGSSSEESDGDDDGESDGDSDE